SDDPEHDMFIATILILEVHGRLFLMRRQLGIDKSQLYRASDPQIHFTGSQPSTTFIGLGQIGPNALDRPGKKTLEANGAGFRINAVVIHDFLRGSEIGFWAASA